MLRLDHLVILVQDLGHAITTYQALGFQVTPGGTHADGLTHNALVVFADRTYLELIAFTDPEDRRDNVWGWRAFLPSGGMIDYCVMSDDLPTDVARLRQRGLGVSDPSTGGRKRPDGTELRWRSARFNQAARILPFLIEDITPRWLRVPSDTTSHPNGAVGITQLVIAAADLPAATASIGALTNIATPPARYDQTLDAQVVTFPIAAQRLQIGAPASVASVLHGKLERHGAGPVGCVLRTADHAATLWLGYYGQEQVTFERRA